MEGMQINKQDNVGVHLDTGHKWAKQDIKKDEDIIMNGSIIGCAICNIRQGEYVHTHNIKMDLDRES